MVAKLFLLQFYLFGCVIVRLRKMLFAVAGLRPQNILLVFLASLENLKFRYEIVLQPSHSIILNIAEGSYRKSDKDFAHFLNQSLASLYEFVAILDLLFDSGYISSQERESFSQKAEDLAKQISAFSRHLKG